MIPAKQRRILVEVAVVTLALPPLPSVSAGLVGTNAEWRRRNDYVTKAVAGTQRPGGRFPDTSQAAEFVYWHWAQLQYQNPEVQLVTQENLFPTAFFRAFLDDGSDVLIDLEGHDRKAIHQRLQDVLGKTSAGLRAEALEETKRQNPAAFGAESERHCACELPGAWPCPSLLPAPPFLKAGWRYNQNIGN